MVVTQELFAAYLNCPTKAYLMRSVIPTEQTKFGRWRADIRNRLRQQGVELLRKQSRLEIKESLTAGDLSAKGSALYVKRDFTKTSIAETQKPSISPSDGKVH